MNTGNTLFLRLEGPLQAWGVTSRFVVRDTANAPSKSGVLGLICAALGLSRAAATKRLPELNTLRLGVRIDRPGNWFTDYHTAGARIGMMASNRTIKHTQATGELETHVMRKEYLADACFLMALQGNSASLAPIAAALQNPAWPPFLGRKCCPPSAPIFAGEGAFDDLESALRSPPWRPRSLTVDPPPSSLWAVIEVPTGDGPIPANARPVQDIPISFTHRVYGMRFVRDVEFSSYVIGNPEFPDPPSQYGRPAIALPGWDKRRRARLDLDDNLCVFCKSRARDVHHITYERSGAEPVTDLRSLCQLCHDALTLLEYAGSMGQHRIDPCDQAHRDAILSQRASILSWRDPLRRNRSLRIEED